jgi:arylsulfatase A-like enzyme
MRIAEYLNSEDLKREPPNGLGYEALTAWKYQRFMEDYLRCVASIDDNVGRVIDWLRERDEFDDTVVIYTSDQGFFLGDHGWFDKRFMYEESLRMPFLISCPSLLPAGRVFDGIVTNVDFAQSLLDAAGVEHHARMQGRSFWPDLLGTPTEPPAEGMYYRYWEHDDRWHRVPGHYGYRTDRYKLVYFYNDGFGLPGAGPVAYPPEWELYDLREDPDELCNVYDDERYQAIRQELEMSMWNAQQRLGDRPHASQRRPTGS